MGAAFDSFNDKLADLVVGMLGKEASQRLAALHAARSAMPDADVYDRIRLARYILTGNEEAPAPPDYEDVQNMAGETVIRMEKRTQTEDYPFQSGNVLVLGPEIFVGEDDNGDDVICWQGVNFVRQQPQEALTGVVGPDPAFEEALKAAQDQEPAPPEDIPEREPAPSAGTHWRGLRGGRPD